MSKKCRQHSAQFKAQVGLDALKGVEPVHAIAASWLHPTAPTQSPQRKRRNFSDSVWHNPLERCSPA